ncbi:MAG: phosphoribosyltransferase [Natronomonas sp.]
MSDLPEEFDCVVPDWEYVYSLSRSVSGDVRASSFEPDAVVALARGGWFAGRCLCDFLGLDDLLSLKMEHYVGTGQKTSEPQIRYPLAAGSLEDKDVLIVDDIADTGKSIERAEAYVRKQDVGTVKTATLQLLETSTTEPDFVGERLQEWVWVVYPWNFIEDMIDLLTGVMESADANTFDTAELQRRLSERHGIGRIELEVAQPGRLGEVLEEMQRREIIEPVDGDRWTLSS